MRKVLPILLLLVTAASTFAAKEALLIANADYAHFGKLPNPVSDARQLADVLRQIGFNVELVENASREGMLDALGSFEERLKASRGVAFFHYGGHGVQVDGKNFLIPADADIPDEKRVATRAVDVDEIMAALDASGSTANVVVLDACRDNPLPSTSTRSAMRGLSVVAQKPKNSIIIYAAEAGSKAQDGLFTPTLARALAVPGRAIAEVMTEVRRDVYDTSGGAQTPGEYNQLFEPLVLAASEADRPPVRLSSMVGAGPVSVPAMEEPSGEVGTLERNLTEVASYWNHNGSVMGLIPEGEKRTFIYVRPRPGMESLVKPGTVLFSGKSDGKSYSGVAKRFHPGREPNTYKVAGPIRRNGSQVVLTGAVQTRGDDGSIKRTYTDELTFDLIETPR